MIFFNNSSHLLGTNSALGVDFHGSYDLSSDLSVTYHALITRGKQAHGSEEIEDGEFDSFGYDVRFHYTDMLTLGVSYIDNSASEDSDPAEDPEFDVESDTFAIYGRPRLIALRAPTRSVIRSATGENKAVTINERA